MESIYFIVYDFVLLAFAICFITFFQLKNENQHTLLSLLNFPSP